MSLGAALNSAVSGLSAQSAALSTISTNIANASTTGYKVETTSFDALVAASSSTGGAAAYGDGVTTGSVQALGTTGEITSSSVTTNMAINGAGFFVASASATATSAGSDVYTRDGSFASDSNGYLVNSSGDYLMGYATNASGDVTSAAAGTLAGLTAIQIPQTVGVTPSTTSTLVANLPAEAAVGGTVTTATNVIDSLGVTQSVAGTWTKGATDASGNTTWSLSLASPTSTTDSTTATGTVTPSAATVVFNSSGQLVSSTQTAADGTVTTDATPGVITGVTLTLASGATSSFSMSVAGLTQTASAADDSKITITSNTTDGMAAGKLASTAIGSDGDVTATYSNGASVIVAKVPVATFANENALTELSGSTYAANSATGTTQLSTAGTNGTGDIDGAALEASTTDTATEFNKMIVAQQAYSAAAQVVTYVDKMFTSLIQAVG